MNADTSETRSFDLSFLHQLAAHSQQDFHEEAQALRQQIHHLWQQADTICVVLGGKAGRLGECVIGTGLLEGCLQLLRATGKTGTPVHILVDAGTTELFPAQSYQDAYWPAITVNALTQSPVPVDLVKQVTGQHILLLDCHGANDGMPYLTLLHQENAQPQDKTCTILGQLFRVGIRSYAQRGPERRYADCITDLFAYPAQTLDGEQVQPRLLPTEQDALRYQQIAQELRLNPTALPILGFFQSVVLAKCYERWDEVMQLLCAYFSQHFPQQKIEFILPCGPDTDLPPGFTLADIAEWLQDFNGVQQNAHVHLYRTETLRDLVVLAQHVTLALSNDTGPGHITGALHVPTIIPYLPGNIYSQHIWSSTRYHDGISLEPGIYTYQQIEAAIIWGKTNIVDSIAPEMIYHKVISHLPPHFQITSE